MHNLFDLFDDYLILICRYFVSLFDIYFWLFDDYLMLKHPSITFVDSDARTGASDRRRGTGDAPRSRDVSVDMAK